MPRTDFERLKAVVEVDEDIVSDDTTAQLFIVPANELVTECCTGDKGPSTPYTEDRLTTIETWLAAHFYAQRDPRIKSETAGPVKADYQHSIQLGFDNTHQGQMAMRLDTNGGLAKLNDEAKKGTRKRARGFHAGSKANTPLKDR
jgi:hypothetical protein